MVGEEYKKVRKPEVASRTLVYQYDLGPSCTRHQPAFDATPPASTKLSRVLSQSDLFFVGWPRIDGNICYASYLQVLQESLLQA